MNRSGFPLNHEQSPADEMCVAETMGLGGKRAFLPSWFELEGDSLQVQLIYFGKPWRVEAHRAGISGMPQR